MAWRGAILGRIRVPVLQQTLDRMAWRVPRGWNRGLSSHGDDHLDKEEVIERVLSVIKTHPKVDPSKVVIERVLSVIKTHPKVDPSKVTPNVHFQNDLGLDSLDSVEIVMALEEEFKLEIPDKEADKLDSCTLAIEYIAAHPMAS